MMRELGSQLDEPLFDILDANDIKHDQMVETPTGQRTALQVLESYVGHALDLIEGTEDAQIPTDG